MQFPELRKTLHLYTAHVLFELVAIDILGTFLRTKGGNRHVIIIPDRYFKLPKAIPRKTIGAIELAQMFMKQWVSNCGAMTKKKHKLLTVAEAPYEVMVLQKTTITREYGNGDEEEASRDKVVLAPTAVENTTGESHWFSKTHEEREYVSH